jgi:hypothetical protein
MTASRASKNGNCKSEDDSTSLGLTAAKLMETCKYNAIDINSILRVLGLTQMQ